ncbi:MAG TPA: SDR family oxidoreductase [Acidimicrobiales bacterium]|nr:SDR family oxidoreductase [Acidimicrobiales bacterium]
MTDKSESRTVVVTGGSSGLGAAVVALLGERGDHPVVVDRRAPEAAVDFVQVDLADRRRAEQVVGDLATDGLDAVVTAAGIDACGRLDDVSATDWERVVAVNLLGTVSVVRAAVPALRERRGRVVTVASTLGLRALPDATAYCASKFGVVGFSRALAAELAGDVGVTCLVPGGMSTPFFDGRPDQYRPPSDADLNDPRRVAGAVLFALDQPWGCEVREIVVCPAHETSWP